MKKRATFALLAVSTVCALAAEPGKQAAPTRPLAPLPALPTLPESLLKWLDPDGSLQLREHPERLPQAVRFISSGRGPVCYFMRTTRPQQPGDVVSRNGFVLLQAVTTGFVKQPDCTSGGALMPAIPAKREIAAPQDGDSTPRD